VKNEIKILAIRRITVIFNRSLYLLFIIQIYENVSLTYLRGLELPELKEEDMPMVYKKKTN